MWPDEVTADSGDFWGNVPSINSYPNDDNPPATSASIPSADAGVWTTLSAGLGKLLDYQLRSDQTQANRDIALAGARTQATAYRSPFVTPVGAFDSQAMMRIVILALAAGVAFVVIKKMAA